MAFESIGIGCFERHSEECQRGHWMPVSGVLEGLFLLDGCGPQLNVKSGRSNLVLNILEEAIDVPAHYLLGLLFLDSEQQKEPHTGSVTHWQVPTRRGSPSCELRLACTGSMMESGRRKSNMKIDSLEFTKWSSAAKEKRNPKYSHYGCSASRTVIFLFLILVFSLGDGETRMPPDFLHNMEHDPGVSCTLISWLPTS